MIYLVAFLYLAGYTCFISSVGSSQEKPVLLEDYIFGLLWPILVLSYWLSYLLSLIKKKKHE
jgi:hypothetical protein